MEKPTLFIRRFLEQANRGLHIFIALALLVAAALVIVQFFINLWQAFEQQIYIRGFLDALGNLFILWILSSLISAEIRWMKFGTFDIIVFVEVVLITLLRQLVLLPVENEHFSTTWAWTYGLVTLAILAVGVVYYLMRRQPPPAVDDPL